jgi:hypothetical protein
VPLLAMSFFSDLTYLIQFSCLETFVEESVTFPLSTFMAISKDVPGIEVVVVVDG